MISKPLIETGPIPDVDREQFLTYVKETGNDPVTVAILTDTNVGQTCGKTGSAANQGRTRKARGSFRAHVRAAIENYNLPPEAAKLYVQAARNQVLNDALEANDHKLALEATKQIGTDQSIFGPVQIEIRTDAIQDLLENTVVENVYLTDAEEVVDNDETT